MSPRHTAGAQPEGNRSFCRRCCLVPDLWRRREFPTQDDEFPSRVAKGYVSYIVTPVPPRKVTLTMENQPFEDDVFSIDNGGFSIVMFVFGGCIYLHQVADYIVVESKWVDVFVWL